MSDLMLRLHEAGHAVAALVLGVPVNRVSATPTEEWGGVCHTDASAILEVEGTDEEEEHAWRHLVVNAAGAVAVHLHTRKPVDWTAPELAGDWESMVDLAVRLAPAPRPGEDTDGSRTIPMAVTAAEVILRTRWSAVLRIAEDLEEGDVENPTLEGPPLEEIDWGE
jgi:hypothetical protein